MKLALGTVQFGLNYGIANKQGQVSHEEAQSILDHARVSGMDTLDTAIAYGDSERRLGEIGIRDWQVISKLPAIPESCTDVTAWVRESVFSSLERLRIPKLRGLLLHRSQELVGPQGGALYRALIALKGQGKIEKIGVSVYGPDELDTLWPHYQLDLVQAPFNIVDHRFATSGWLARLHQAGIEIHIRAVFLQGLLLMEPARRPETFNRWQPLWDKWHHWLDDQSLTPLQACLGFVLTQPEIDRVVVGVDSRKQLEEILSAAKTMGVSVPQSFATEDLQLINPSNWVKQ